MGYAELILFFIVTVCIFFSMLGLVNMCVQFNKLRQELWELMELYKKWNELWISKKSL